MNALERKMSKLDEQAEKVSATMAEVAAATVLSIPSSSLS